MGPALGARAVFDLIAEPLARALGYTAVPRTAAPGRIAVSLRGPGGAVLAAMIVVPWGESPGQSYRSGVHGALAENVRWFLWMNGASIRIWDARRVYARKYAEFNLRIVLDDQEAFRVLWRLVGADSLAAGEAAVLPLAVAQSELHRVEVRAALRAGVHDALLQFISAFRAASSRRHGDPRILAESLIIVYRILFLLFAEARALVPQWHPVYRDGYTIQALTRSVKEGGEKSGVWEALQALARLAHRGCRAGTLRVPPFNGRLFSPVDAPLADSLSLDDRIVARGLAALTTSGGREIAYGDLGVEQLGSVYEHLLDFDIGRTGKGAPAVLVRTGRRKATGSFYTPRGLTEFLARRALTPLVAGASPEQILALRVLDPAMGSGAFLVAACRFLASAYEQSLIAEGSVAPCDLGEGDRAAFRRAVAQRCLFGVDVNPMAVQLGKLSLWLATLAADRPLTFLDHHLQTGDSLVGAAIADVRRGRAMARRQRDLPLFAEELLQSGLRTVVHSRLEIAGTPDDTLEQVRGKERALAAMERSDGPLGRWRAAADLWCATWYADDPRLRDGGVVRALLDRVLTGSGPLPVQTAEPLLLHAREIADRRRFFHWSLRFPEIFYDSAGEPLEDPGFDAVLGNPPWDMVREDPGAPRQREMHAFARSSGVYRLHGRGHMNLYHLFLERAIALLKRRGRAGLVLPAGVATEQSSSALRGHLLRTASIDTLVMMENRTGIFPIHRAVKFAVATFGRGRARSELPVRSGVRSLEVLDSVPDEGEVPGSVAIPLSLLERMNPESLAIPEIGSTLDLEIVADISARIPPLGAREGWCVHFGRELNATDDRPHFRERGPGLAVLEGKHLRPFIVLVERAKYRISEAAAARIVEPAATFERPRLAYRDVASAANRTTLIAAIVPAGAITTHTLFCLKEPLEEEAQQFLCGVFNSYVANYLVRMVVGTHVTTAIVSRLPVPTADPGSPAFRAVAGLSRAISQGGAEDLLARLNAMVGRLYGFSDRRFAHVLGTFPLVPAGEREAALAAFRAG